MSGPLLCTYKPTPPKIHKSRRALKHGHRLHLKLEPKGQNLFGKTHVTMDKDHSGLHRAAVTEIMAAASQVQPIQKVVAVMVDGVEVTAKAIPKPTHNKG
jgi:hypothetical protein